LCAPRDDPKGSCAPRSLVTPFSRVVRGSSARFSIRQAEFFHGLWDNPGGAVKKETLLALELSPDYRHECGICDRNYMYMLRRGCP
jgi:hypothetical protein